MANGYRKSGAQTKKCTKQTIVKSTNRSQMSSRGKLCNWRYLAGLFDGEGSVSIADRARKRTGKRAKFYVKYPYYAMWVRITNTSRTLMESIHREFGGTLYDHQKKGYKPNWRAQSEWCTKNAAESLRVLKGMLPHLRYKKPEAILAIEFLSRVKPNLKGVPLSEEEAQERARIVAEIKSLEGRRRCFGIMKKGIR